MLFQSLFPLPRWAGLAVVFCDVMLWSVTQFLKIILNLLFLCKNVKYWGFITGIMQRGFYFYKSYLQ